MTGGLGLGLDLFTGGLGRLGALEGELGLDTLTGGLVLGREALASGLGLGALTAGLVQR